MNWKQNWTQSLPHLLLVAALVALVAYVHLFFTTKVEPQRPIRIGIILPERQSLEPWYRIACQGLADASDAMGAEYLVETDAPDSPAGMEAIDRLHAQGANIIVSATYGYGDLFQTAGQKYLDTNFYTIIPSHYTGNVRTYFVRIYQLRYLQGILAGLKTKTGQIGFISYDLVPDNLQELNAFALGVRRVNPDAHVLAAFQTLAEGTDENACRLAARMVKDAHVDVLASHRSNDAVAAYAVEHGIYGLACYDEAPDSPLLLARTVINWKKVWSSLLKDNVRNSNPLAFYWFDFNEADMALAITSPDVTDAERAQVAQAEDELRNGFEPFSGDIRDNEGNVRCRAGEYIDDVTLRQKMDWFVEGVILYE